MLQLKDGRHPDFDLLGAEFSVAEADVALGRPAARAENCAAIAMMINLSREVPSRYVVSAARAGIGLIDKELPSRRSEADRLLHDVEAAARTNSIGPCAAGVGPAVVAQHSAPAALLSSSHAH
jgi:hypothetical protein